MAKTNKPSFERSEWIFDWKRPTSSPVTTGLIALVLGGVFAVVLVTLRVKLVEPVDWVAPQASVIHLSGEGWSRAMAMEAQAKGPFPSRFEPDRWPGADGMRSVMTQASQPRLKAHQPRLLPFPEPGIEAPRMARRGEPVLPYRPLAEHQPQAVNDLRLVPILSALDGIQVEELPAKLPVWNEPVTELLASRTWNYLAEIDPSGRVWDCVALAGGNELNPQKLTAWLRGVVFRPKAADLDRRWVAIAVKFENRATGK